MTSDQLLEELGTMLGRCVKVIRELETENEELKARREWVGLTEEEMRYLGNKLFGFYPGPDGPIVQLARAIEAALKEKNGGGA